MHAYQNCAKMRTAFVAIMAQILQCSCYSWTGGQPGRAFIHPLNVADTGLGLSVNNVCI